MGTMSKRQNFNKCSICSREFALKSSLKIHELSHSKEDKPHECTVCGRQFTLQTSLKTHMLSHAPKSPFECKSCGENFTLKKELMKHMKTHIKIESESGVYTETFPAIDDVEIDFLASQIKKFVCSVCSEEFPNKTSLKRHVSTHTTVKKPFCLSCNKKFHCEELLQKHVEQTVFLCGICTLSFKICDDLRKHMRVHSCECMICGERFSCKSEVKKHALSHGQDLNCTICPKKFGTQWKLLQHLQRVHSKVRDVQCDFCGKMYTKQYLQNHLKTHTGERHHKCDMCGATFVQGVHLKTHMKSHSGIKDHQCDICGKSFTLRCTLTHHYRTHTGERPYKCEVCNKSFVQLSSLTQHKQVHFPSGPHQCLLCDKKYAYKYTLNAHYREHSPEELEKLDQQLFNSIWNRCRVRAKRSILNKWDCDACGKTFKVKANLLMHVKLHTGEKPHSCSLCGKAFRLKANLRTHERTHTGIRPFECRVCTKRFVQQSHLKAHMVLHTGGKPHICKICGKSFGYKNNLIAHRKIHLRDLNAPSVKKLRKILTCVTCRMSFPTKGKFENHVKLCIKKFEDIGKEEFSDDSFNSDISGNTRYYFTAEKKEDIINGIYTVPSIVCASDVPLDQEEQDLKSQLILSLSENTLTDNKVDIVVQEFDESDLEVEVHDMSFL